VEGPQLLPEGSDRNYAKLSGFALHCIPNFLAMPNRVTRLNEFSPIGRLFAVGSFLKITEAAIIFKLPFSAVKVMHKCRQKTGWAKYWATF
jgi:hypothetical protein